MSLQVRESLLPAGRVRWRETGHGAPVIMIPGLGLTGRFYDVNADAFAAAGFRFIVPDMPALGATRGRRTGSNIETCAAFIRSFLDLIDEDGVHLIGHSIGAQTALCVAATAPDRVRTLCLVGPTGSHSGIARRMLHQSIGLLREAAHAGVRVLGAVARDYLRTNPLAYAGTWVRGARDEPYARARHVTCPTLLVVGSDDPVAEHEFVERLAAAIPDARIAWLSGAGHALPRGCASAFNAAVIAFLQAITERVSDDNTKR